MDQIAFSRVFQGKTGKNIAAGFESPQNRDGRRHFHVRWEGDNWEKKACGLIIGDQYKKRDLLTHVVQEENLTNATALLEQLKADYRIQPELVVCDLSPQLIGAIQAVFGENVVQIDGFHVMRELNTGIKRDLLDFRAHRFQTEIRELKTLRAWVTSVQKQLNQAGNFSEALNHVKLLPQVPPDHLTSRKCMEFTANLVDLLRIDTPALFFPALGAFLRGASPSADPPRAAFSQELLTYLPKNQLTRKGMERTKQLVLQKVKAYYLGFRSELEDQSRQFFKDHWVLFFQPNKLTTKRAEKLKTFLATYPELQIYRQMTLQVGEIYRLAPEQIDGHQIDALTESPTFSEKLNTAIRTLKKYKASILRFIALYKREPHLPKACRANMEQFNARFKAPFTRGNNLLKKDRLLARLNCQLAGKIEWLLEDKALV